MVKKVLDVRCPHCNAPIHFNAKVGKMKCEYCDSEFDAKEVKKETGSDASEVVDETKYVTYLCQDCGAEIIADEQTSATFCLYCGNTAILRNKLTGKFAPSKVIPFKTTKEEAIEAFKNIGKGRPLMPKAFNNVKNIEKIRGLYVPFWLYQVDVDGVIDYKATKVQSWSRGDTHYTKTDYYDVTRGGSMKYVRVPVDGSTRFDNDIMNTIEPFHYSGLVDYNPAYLSGFLAEKYDIDKFAAFDDARKRTLKSTNNYFDSSVKGYATKIQKSNSLVAYVKSEEYVLLPVWMVNVKYKDKYYIFAMNGQTGEFIGNIPLDKKKAFLYFLYVFAIAFLIVFMIGSLLMVVSA